MSELNIDIANDQQAFMPGQVLSGEVRWSNQRSTKNASLRLLWYTQGKGTEDIGVAESIDFDNAQPTDRYSFEFRLPAGPHSFSGRLISLIWALELQVGKEWVRKEIILSPTGSEILLGTPVSDPSER